MEKYSLIGELTDHYYTNDLEDGRVEISILIPEKFKRLWIDKLNNLYTTNEEIEYYQTEERQGELYQDKENEQNTVVFAETLEKKIKGLTTDQILGLNDYLANKESEG